MCQFDTLSILTLKGSIFFMIIYLLSVPNIDDFEVYTEYLRFVSNERKSKIDAYKFNKNKTVSLFAELLIRYIISNDLNISNENIIFDYNEYGKPILKDFSRYNFSISHTNNTIVFISNELPIGIDIEKINKGNLSLSKRFFTSNEYEHLKNSGNLDIDFFKIWTMKESYIKMLGTGLYTSLSSFDIFKPSNKYKYYNTLYGEYSISVCYQEKDIQPIGLVPIEYNIILDYFK